MRKVLTISGIVIIILCVLGQLLLPPIVSGAVGAHLKRLLDIPEISVEISSVPALLLGTGYIGTLDITAENGRLGKGHVSSLHLIGSGVKLDSSVITTGHFAVQSADKLELSGIVTEANLKEYLEKSVKKLKDVQVVLKPEGVSATGKLELLGKEADVLLEGSFEVAEEGILLRTRHVQIKNSRLGRNLNMNLFKDFLVVDVSKLKLPLRADEVIMEQGRAIVRASYRF